MATNMAGVGETRYRRIAPAPPPAPSTSTPSLTLSHGTVIARDPELESAPPRELTPVPTTELTSELRPQEPAPSQGLAAIPTVELSSIPSGEALGAGTLPIPSQEAPGSAPEVSGNNPFETPPSRQPTRLPAIYAPPPSTLPEDLRQLYTHWQEASSRQARIISDATQFVDIAPYIDTGVDPVTSQPVLLDLKCPCCGYHLDVPARVSPNLYPDAPLEPLTVLPCGHMIGSHCMDNWMRSRDEERELPNCPVCRFELVHKHCGCLIRTPGYNTLLSRAAQLPLTIVEGGAVDYNCGPCRDRRADWALRTWLEEHLPSNRIANLMDTSLTRAQQRRLQACVGEVARSARNWHREHSPRW